MSETLKKSEYRKMILSLGPGFIKLLSAHMILMAFVASPVKLVGQSTF